MLKILDHWLVIVALSAVAVALRLWDPAPISQLRLYAFDTYQRIEPRAYDADLPVRIVDIDEASLRAYGQWPWPRTRLADLVRRLDAMGAAAIGLDFIFAEPDRTSPEQLIAALPQDEQLMRIAERVASAPTHDEQFAEAIGDAGIVLGMVLNNSTQAGGPPRASFAHSGDDPRLFVYGFSGATGNIALLERAAAGLGALNWVPDFDQITRRIPLIAKQGDRLYPAFSAELLRVAQGATTYVVKSSGASGVEAYGAQTGVAAVRIGEFEVPTTATGEMWLHYAGHRPERFVSATDILQGTADSARIAGHIVLVGTSASALFDLRATPLDVVVAGVEIQAEAIEQVISGAALIRPDFALAAELAYLAGLGLVMALLIARIGPQWTGLVAVGLLVAGNAVSWFAFSTRGWLVDPVYPSLMGAAIYVAGTVTGYLRTEIERDRVRDAFGHYLAPSLVEQLAADPRRLSLGGEIRELTILFTDIRGFTGIAEAIGPTELTAFLNRFLTPMTDTILSREGTIDKYMGDAIMAFWNAPLDDPDHARHACLAALEMERRLDVLNRELARETTESGEPWPPIRIGIGINTGPCCVGNLGSRQRFAYSAIGDDVNIAARLESQTKVYATPIVVGEATARLTPELAFVEIDRIRVHGRTAPVSVFALLGDAAAARTPRFGELTAAHREMLEAFRSRQWDEAGRRLAACARLDDGRLSTVYAIYRERIGEFAASEPPEGWDSVVAASDK